MMLSSFPVKIQKLTNRLLRWVRHPAKRRNRQLIMPIKGWVLAPWRVVQRRFPHLFLPGPRIASEYFFNSYPEIYDLFKKFTARNLSNTSDITRLWLFILNITQIITEGIPGDFAELGVWKGNTAAILAHYAAKANRNVFLFDTWEGFSQTDLTGIDDGKRISFRDSQLEFIHQVLGSAGRVCHFVKGYFPESVNETHQNRTYAVVSIDCDLYLPTKSGLEFFYPRMPVGGLLLLHDYANPFWDGPKQAIDEFCQTYGERIILIPDNSGTAIIRKSGNTPN